MKRFDCPNCGNEVHFESSTCVLCGQTLGMRPPGMEMVALAGTSGKDGMQLCRNADTAGCNWLASADNEYCTACQHNRTVPDISVPGHRASWMQLELAKRKLIYALDAWRLPRPTRQQDPERGLAFDFLAEVQNPDGSVSQVSTGHQDGVITLNLAEGNEAERAERKEDLREPYRTVVGHLRHEVGHYYWMLLVEGGRFLEEYRQLFGDETADYGEALERHYVNGPKPGWEQTFISAYASAHPWEDFAETWAHWMHIVDGLETASAYGLSFADRSLKIGNVYEATDITPLVEAWVDVTVAINSMNRGMGQPDLYPFVLSKPVVEKLSFINRVIHSAAC